MPKQTLPPRDKISVAVGQELKVALIRSRFNSATDFSVKVHLDHTWLSRRLTGRTPLTIPDLVQLCEHLERDPVDLLRTALDSCATDA